MGRYACVPRNPWSNEFMIMQQTDNTAERLIAISLPGISMYLGWMGTVAGLFGALTLALNTPLSPYGYVFFLISSTHLLGWAAIARVSHQVLLQGAFTVINAIGAYQWLVVGA